MGQIGIKCETPCPNRSANLQSDARAEMAGIPGEGLETVCDVAARW